VHAGPRELADVLLIPFEMAVLDGGVDSVMNSYAEVDGMPVAADASLLTTLLREKWGFTGTVVADYFAIAFLQTLHGVAADLGDAGGQALFAGIDVELPTGVTYLKPLAEAIRAGKFKEEYVDRALRRVLAQKERLGLLAPDYDPAAPLKNLNADGIMDLDPPEHRALARELAEEAIVLLANKTGVLPLDPGKASKIAVIGPNADDTSALFGCYSFANHVLAQHPKLPVCADLPFELSGALINFRRSVLR
jgi:beta-glucosidase-like glycosyl hydrolase